MFSKKVTVITGGATGIGESVARRFCVEGSTTYVLDIMPLSRSTQDQGAQYIECNVADFEAVQHAISEVWKKEGRIDHLFANAGIHLHGSIEDTSVEALDQIVDVNFKGIFYTLKCVLPIMRKQNAGSIVLTGSDQCFVGKTESAAYGATKGAIGQLTKSTAVDYAKYNLRINCICPGTVNTPLFESALQSIFPNHDSAKRDELVAGLTNGVPMRRTADPEEIAHLVMFLCSDQSSFMTGALVPIDGGFTAN